MSLHARAAMVVATVAAATLGTLVVPAQAETVTAVENDFNGDGEADLVVVGSQGSLAPGLWLAAGTAGGGLAGTPSNIGAAGVTGVGGSNPSPEGYNGLQVVVGHFRSGSGPNDVLLYDPAYGLGKLLYGTGDGSPLNELVGKGVVSGTFTSRTTHANATSIANAGQLYTTAAQGEPNPFPALLSVLDGALWLQPTSAQSGGFFPAEVVLADTNPTGAGNWNGWSITTALVDDMPALFARSEAGGQLYYYSPAALLSLTLGTPAAPVLVAAQGWDAAAKPVVQAADVDHDGIVDLRAVDPSGNAVTYRFDGSTLTALGSHNLLTGADTAPGGTTTAPGRHPHKPEPHKPEPHKPEPHGH
ncbi:hypothetical protein [Kitasatospora griseola]|uniref:hypothetical protein n=1 Tax=Kitasatospora griseola TaxID=2064 RepID=UPI0036578586